jgi:hypothetical protein
MTRLDLSGDPERILLDLEQQMQHYPFRPLRLTGNRNRMLGLFLLPRSIPLAETVLQRSLTEIALQLEEWAGVEKMAAGLPHSSNHRACPAAGRSAGFGLPHLEERLASEIERVRQTRLPCGLILLQIGSGAVDPLPEVHAQLPGKATELIRAVLRKSDVLLAGHSFRFGVILPGTSLRETTKCAERIRKALANEFPSWDIFDPAAAVSIGLVFCQASDRESAGSLTAKAAKELARAVELGGNRICQAALAADSICQVTAEERAELFGNLSNRDRQL